MDAEMVSGVFILVALTFVGALYQRSLALKAQEHEHYLNEHAWFVILSVRASQAAVQLGHLGPLMRKVGDQFIVFGRTLSEHGWANAMDYKPRVRIDPRTMREEKLDFLTHYHYGYKVMEPPKGGIVGDATF